VSDPVTAVPKKIVVTGASGNVGDGVLRALASAVPSAEVVGVCRRPPTQGELYERVRWHAVDLSWPDAAQRLAPAMRGADVVIHLALSLQPVRDEDYLYRANVLGSARVLQAMAAADIKHLVYASSLGVYAAGATGPVTENWPDTGQPTSVYSRHKVAVERLLDRFVTEHPDTTVARFRPTVVVSRKAWMIHTLYLGPFVPAVALKLLQRRMLPVLPLPQDLSLQFVHSDDVGDAAVRLMLQGAQGSFNIASDVLDSHALAGLVGARPLAVSPRVFRVVVSALNRLRLLALTPGWYDVATKSPLMDTSKARRELGWVPIRSSADSARELIDGLADGVIGSSAATGLMQKPSVVSRRAIGRFHDATLLMWTALAAARAAGIRQAGAPDVAVIAANLLTGTPAALDRILARRRDPVALAAPIAVLAAVATSRRGGWMPVAATAILHALNAIERMRPVVDE